MSDLNRFPFASAPDSGAGNPYAAPTAPSTSTETELTHYGAASSGQRFIHFLVDHLGSQVLSIVLGIAAALLWPELLTELSSPLVAYGFGGVAIVLYYVLWEGFSGRSLGKLLTRTKVIHEDGGRPSLGQIVGRSFARLIPFEAFSFLGGRAGFHDTISRTRVVRLTPSDLQRAMERV